MPAHKLDNYLRTYRKRSGFSQDELAYLLGAGAGAKVSRYERSGRQPSLDTALAYQAIFKIPADQLFAGRFQKADHAVARRARFLARRLSGRPRTPGLSHKLEALGVVRGLATPPTPTP